jgi:hypothetical protein
MNTHPPALGATSARAPRVTLTRYDYYARVGTNAMAVNPRAWSYRSLADALAMNPGASAEDIIEVSHSYRVGEPVKVRAYGAWRHGTVTKLGRTRVTVTYIRNQSGTRASKSFGATEIRPRPSN